MVTLDVYDIMKKKVSEIQLSDKVFGQPYNESVIYQVVRAKQMNRRQGTACTKTKAEVRGTGRKPWRQKHTGRARHGTMRSPLWRGGAVAFGPRPKDYDLGVPERLNRKAMCIALSDRIRDNSVFVIDKVNFSDIKTKHFCELLKRFELEGALVIDDKNRNLMLSVRNHKNSKYLNVENINIVDLMKYNKLIVSQDAIKKIEEVLSK
ncbi:MAG: 50S ribosomal protein L4 [Deltaproteobacteria bacterium]|nr:50S ribosomal protein L4 [Deltaproteobacteria bacterium]